VACIVGSMKSSTPSNYERYLALCVSLIEKYGDTGECFRHIENVVPQAWAADLIADALAQTGNV